ncbi:MAG TPA: hypothetical protein VLE95_01945 [Chlamydiales bacterium]|nr:hypothetical protein [Chlamydiales bacterium]
MNRTRAIRTMDQYVKSLKKQASVAEAFYFGRIEEGMHGLLSLPKEIRLKIEQLIWDGAKGESVDPTERGGQELICDAILFSLEERMGY